MTQERICKPGLEGLVMSAPEASAYIKSGMTVGFGGYTSSGYPKAIARELVKNAESGEFKISVVTGSNNGPLDTMLAQAGIISRRAPMIESKALAQKINSGEVQYVEQQMNKMPRLIRTGAFGKIDVAVIEAMMITPEGHLVPTSSCGMVPDLLDAAERIIVEINTAQPVQLIGMHDIYRPSHHRPIPMTGIDERFGTPYIEINDKKICAIVFSDEKDETKSLPPATEAQKRITDNLLNFLELEMNSRKCAQLPPVQTGFGNLASEIVYALGRSSFRDLEFFCGGIQEANVELVASGKARAASCGSIKMSPEVIRLLEGNEHLRKRIVIRNGEVTNSSEVISRMAPITLTSGVEMDIYGNVNSSHVSGSRVVNGLGGGANFAENAGLSIMLLPSENKGGKISTIVPMVSHQDICEHDIDVVITENGIADLRGKSDVERAAQIIENCSSTYKTALRSYFDRAKTLTGGHHPVILEEAFSWHMRLKETGTMQF